MSFQVRESTTFGVETIEATVTVELSVPTSNTTQSATVNGCGRSRPGTCHKVISLNQDLFDSATAGSGKITVAYGLAGGPPAELEELGTVVVHKAPARIQPAKVDTVYTSLPSFPLYAVGQGTSANFEFELEIRSRFKYHLKTALVKLDLGPD